jgi:hypothetical protein
MDQSQALKVLLQAATVAQSRGAYSLQEASAIAEAVTIFTVEPSSANVEKNTSEKKDDRNNQN